MPEPQKIGTKTNSSLHTTISLPELFLVAGTRALLGCGIGLLLADRLGRDQRRAVGWTLLSVGALSTIPLAFEVLGGRRVSGGSVEGPEFSERVA